MNSKTVLGKIFALLAADKEVNFVDAKSKDGAILQSPTFDVGEKIDVVSEDGTLTPAPDGEHEVSLKDSEGNEVLIKVITKDGKIVERENVELEEKVDEEVVDKDVEEKDEEDVEMADATTEEAKALPNTTDESKANEVKEGGEEDPLISLSYRIDELEKAMKKLAEPAMDEEMPADDSIAEDDSEEVAMAAEEEEEEEELPKLDGAPIEAPVKFNQAKSNSGKVANSQNTFLSKLYS
jgi:hypothetical protein